jgi:hypothetical protein
MGVGSASTVIDDRQSHQYSMLVGPEDRRALAETLRSLIGQNILMLPLPVQYHEPITLLQRNPDPLSGSS